MTLPKDAYKIFVFDDVYPLSAAAEQANKKKLNAFGLAAKLNPFKRPKDETVLLAKDVKRYEPFWHVVTNREVDFSRQINYPVDIGNSFANCVVINGQEYPIAAQSGKRTLTLSAIEKCHRKIDFQDYIDALERESKKGVLESYLKKYKVQERESIELPNVIPLKVSVATLLQRINQTLSSEAINAHEIQQDFISIEKAHLYYRPVYAFEFSWTTENKVGVIEVDGLTGEVIEDGQWFKEKMDSVLTREMLFEASAEIAGVIVPGGGIAVKVVERVTARK
ncbi:hypothetical protein KTQ42_22940 [Noviherbaspirillum sp. L7-7A]|uniref:hypothetical protein n=1 Tax=Noviherbaspirillum sp. L7-7A TaxID=2850560 RepID=UPI001C2BF80C|nr:hypothetical protein [Noviherbaspirillum sp. L7-7A]MBV0882137.1 hypothetical protein [Noviherbaspirillum sp. L7-7A]